LSNADFQTNPAMALVRLQKFLSEAGACSRRKGEAHILAGDVSVNGMVVSTLGTKVDPEADVVHLNGMPVGKRRIGTSM
jgi:23S rRNA pseudouridine2605 synthase